MANKYRKKPVIVEAMQWTMDNYDEICKFIDSDKFSLGYANSLIIRTMEGDHYAREGDYIIKGIKGEFYPCKPDIFEQTYESVY